MRVELSLMSREQRGVAVLKVVGVPVFEAVLTRATMTLSRLSPPLEPGHLRRSARMTPSVMGGSHGDDFGRRLGLDLTH
jgi:hypothetical protein